MGMSLQRLMLSWHRLLLLGSVLVTAMPLPPPAWGAWSITGEGNVFYTDDVALFSASRRLALDEDPTQPVVEETGQGTDQVSEPVLRLRREIPTRLGVTTLWAKAQGFIYALHPDFNHGTLGLQLMHKFPRQVEVKTRYYYAPDLFLGRNRVRRTGNETLADERFTTHFWTVRAKRRFQDFSLELYGRYGLRLYNDAFEQRDTQFWTVGPHLEWRAAPTVRVNLGYHFERGLADGRHEPQLADDVSYINHYVSSELNVDLSTRTALAIAFHFERNDYTSGLVGDRRRGGFENVFQGDAILRYHLTPSITLTTGFQRSQRKASFEEEATTDNNVWVGGAYRF